MWARQVMDRWWIAMVGGRNNRYPHIASEIREFLSMLGFDVYVCSVWMVRFYVYPSMFFCCVVSSIMTICWFNRDAGKFNELIDSLRCLISVNNTCHVYWIPWKKLVERQAYSALFFEIIYVWVQHGPMHRYYPSFVAQCFWKLAECGAPLLIFATQVST